MAIDRPDWNAPVVMESQSLEALPGTEVDVFDQNSPGVPSGEGLDSTLLAEWSSAGGVEFHLNQARNLASAALDSMGDESESFLSTFDGLSERIRTAVFSEIALGSPGSTKAASASEISELAGTDWGVLLKEWGARAPKKVGVVNARLNRIENRLNSTEAIALYDWYANLSDRQARGVLRALAG